MPPPSMNRRDFARLFAAGGSAALLGHPAFGRPASRPRAAPLVRRTRTGQEVDWEEVRARFLMPPELSVMNAANLCPSPASTLQAVYDYTERMDREPVPTFRDEMRGVKESTRDRLAGFLGVTPEEILITRNTSEANNWVSTGLELGPGDEVVVVRDNHPSNHLAWQAKGYRFGFTVNEIEPPSPHPGADYYVRRFREAITPATRVIAFTHLTNTAGDLFPARELCALARENGVLSAVDGAQSFGLFDVDLSEMRPDFYTGSAHKWPCGPKETGVLYVNAGVHDRFWPTMYSAYSGSRGLARTHEGMGQRDEPAIHALGAQIEFLEEITMAEVEARSRELATALVEELSALDGVHMWTSPDPARRAAVVTFRPADLAPGDVVAALEEDGIVAAARGGSDRPGVRLSPHFYNSYSDVERAVSAIRGYLRTGL